MVGDKRETAIRICGHDMYAQERGHGEKVQEVACIREGTENEAFGASPEYDDSTCLERP